MAGTVAGVQQIIDTSQGTAVIQRMLDAADEYMDAALSSGDLTTAQKDEIQEWLAAHMLALTWDRSAIKEKVGDAEATWTGKFGMKLESTEWGQMVLTLDTSGKLGAASKKAIIIKSVNEDDD